VDLIYFHTSFVVFFTASGRIISGGTIETMASECHVILQAISTTMLNRVPKVANLELDAHQEAPILINGMGELRGRCAANFLHDATDNHIAGVSAPAVVCRRRGTVTIVTRITRQNRRHGSELEL
jgi:hypothetical protein